MLFHLDSPDLQLAWASLRPSRPSPLSDGTSGILTWSTCIDESLLTLIAQPSLLCLLFKDSLKAQTACYQALPLVGLLLLGSPLCSAQNLPRSKSAHAASRKRLHASSRHILVLSLHLDALSRNLAGLLHPAAYYGVREPFLLQSHRQTASSPR